MRWAQETADALREQRKAALAPVQEQILSVLQPSFENSAIPVSLINDLEQFMTKVAIATRKPKPKADESPVPESSAHQSNPESYGDYENIVKVQRKRAPPSKELEDHLAIVLDDLMKRKDTWT